jgi:hypothetical protein
MISRLANRIGGWLMAGMLFLGGASCTHGNRIQGGEGDTLQAQTPISRSAQASQAVATLTTAGGQTSQPTDTEATQESTALPTVTVAGTFSQTATLGAQVEGMLNDLDRMNQSADGLADVP